MLLSVTADNALDTVSGNTQLLRNPLVFFPTLPIRKYSPASMGRIFLSRSLPFFFGSCRSHGCEENKVYVDGRV